jgi:ABC-type branched-subunit amino acid transport system ATPase component
VLGGFAIFGLLTVPLQTFISFFLDQRWNLGPGARGLFFAYVGAMAALGLVVYGRRGEAEFQSSPARVPRTVGALLAVYVGLVALGGLSPSFWLMIACFGVGSAMAGPLSVGLTISMLSIIPSRMRPHAQALGGIFIAIGGVVGALFFAGINNRYGIAGSMVSVAVPGLIAAWIISTAGKFIEADLDRMIDETLEDEEIKRLQSAGSHLPMMACRKVNFAYGQLQVLFDVDFTVDDGEMVALLGTNGAGKSTLLKVISGIGLPMAGTVRFRGEDITYLDAERRLRLGITQIPGGRAVFGRLTVVENLRSFGYTLGRDRRALDTAIDLCLATFPRLAERRNSVASTLSGGEQQMLGLSKALILRPRLLLIDELSLGLAPVIVGQLLEMVRAINSDGTAVVLVEQSVNIALNLVQHAYFMEKGEMRFDGRSEDLLARDDLLRAVFLRGATAGSKL